METDFSALRQTLHAARLQTHGRDHTSNWVRITLDRLVEGVLKAQNGLPTASFTFLKQISTPAYAVALGTVSWSSEGTLTAIRPGENRLQRIALAVHSTSSNEEFAVEDLDALIDYLKHAIDNELATSQ